MDRMISLIEGAKRQKTPNEIALSILLSALTIIFLVVCVTLKPFAIYIHSYAPNPATSAFTVTVLIALLVCLIPTTIGGLLSAIGIAGIDRMVQKNVLAMSGRAVEAAGDVHVLLLDKTGTITHRQPAGGRVPPAPGGYADTSWRDAAQLASLADETPGGQQHRRAGRREQRSRRRELTTCPDAAFVPFTRADAHERRRHATDASIRKGAPDAVAGAGSAGALPAARCEDDGRGDRAPGRRRRCVVAEGRQSARRRSTSRTS